MKKLTLSLLLGLGFASQTYYLAAEESLALGFNGTNSIIEFPAIRFDEYEEFTAEAWVYNWSGYLFSQGPFGDPENSVWMATGNNYYSSGWESNNGKPNHEFSTGLPEPGKWVHVAMVYDGVNQFVFVQGKVRNKIKAPKPGPLNPNRSFTIGAEPSPSPEFGANYGSGLIKVLRISNKARYLDDFAPPERFDIDQHTVFHLTPRGINGTKVKNLSNEEHNGLARDVSVIKDNDINTIVIKGIVLNPDEAPLANCSVSLGSEGQRQIMVRTDIKGEFYFILNTPKSTYEITAEIDDLRRGITEIKPSVLGNEKLRIKLFPSTQKHLSNMSFLTGDWFREGQTNDGLPYRLEISNEWGSNGNFIFGAWAFKSNGITWMSGNSTSYWDAQKEEIVKLGFDSRGGHYKSILSVDEKGQVTESRTSTNQDGEATERGFVIKPIDGKSYTRQRMSINAAGELEVGGEENTIFRVPKYIK